MRLSAFAVTLALALMAAACASPPPSATTYQLVKLDVRGADLFASIADSGLSADDCDRAADALPMAVCEVEAGNIFL